MSSNRYYYYDHENCTFVEVQTERRKVLAKASGVLLVVLFMAGVIALVLDQTVGTPEEVALRAENEALQQQLSLVQERMEEFSTELRELSEHDQSLYRTLLEAEPISEDVRQVGVGGTDPYERFKRFDASTSDLLQTTSQTLDRLEYQITLQNTSYRELSELASEREAWMRQMPAILPADGPIVSGYGVRRHPILRVRRMHHGIDLLINIGTPVAATGDGVVKTAGWGGGYGNFVEIEHPESGYVTLYAHLSEISDHIRPGLKVKRGEQIGLSGNSGRSTGPHLHYEVRDTDDKTHNPILFFMPSMTPQEYKKLRDAAESSHISMD